MQATQTTIDNLRKLRSELMQRASAIDTDIHHKNEPVEKDFAEQVTQRENDDVLNALSDDAKQKLILIDSALARIDQGNYGICERCGKEIPHDRLAAIPYATTCISCAE